MIKKLFIFILTLSFFFFFLKFVKKTPSDKIVQLKNSLIEKYNSNQANLEDITRLGLIYKLEGNYKKSYEIFKTAINSLNENNSFLAEIYLYLIDYLADETEFENDYLKFLQDYSRKIDNKYYIKDISLFLLMNLLLKRGDIEQSKKIASALGFINEWYIIGPFKNESRAGMEIQYLPEFEINFDKTYTEGAFHPVRWRKIFNPGTAEIDLKNYFTPDKNCVTYLLTFIEVPESKYYYIGIGSDDGYKLWINDKLIKENDIYRKAYFDQERIRVYLKKGINKILLKISQQYYKWKLYFRIKPVDYKVVLSSDILEKYKSSEDYEIESKNEKIFPDYYKQIPFLKDFFVGYYYFITGNYPDYERLDSEYFSKAIKSESQNPVFYYYYALATSAKEEFKKHITHAIRLYNLNLEAKLRLGIFYLNKNYFNSALKLFNEIINLNPEFYNAYFYRGKLFYKKRLFQEALKDFNKCISAGYNYWNSLYYIANIYWEQKEYEQAGKNFLKSFNLNPLHFNIHKYSRIFEYLNYTSQKAKIPEIYFRKISLKGATPSLYNELAQFYLYNKQSEQALNIINKSLKTDPYNTETLKIASDISLSLSRTNEAVKYLKQILEVNPHNKNIKRRILYLKGEKESIVEKYKPNTSKIIKKLFSKELEWYKNKYSDSGGITFYHSKIVKISKDGTKETLVTSIYYVLNNTGIDIFKSERINYDPLKEEVEIISARTITRDGTQTETSDIKERSLIDIEKNLYYNYYTKIVTFSDVKIDSAIIFQYRIWSKSDSQLEKSYFGSVELFADFYPVMQKEIILIAPSSIKLYYKYINFTRKPTLKKHRKSGYIIYKWKQKNLLKLEYEPDMISPFSIAPQIQISTFSKWSEVARWISNLSKPQIRLNYKMRALVDEVKNNSNTKQELISKLFDYVRDNIRYVGLEYGVSGIKPRNAISIFSSKFGDCKDKSILLISLLRYAGIDAYLGLVRTSDRGESKFPLPLVGMFDHAICVAYIKNRPYFLDATASYYRYDEPPYYLGVNKIFLIKEGNARFINPPVISYKDNLFESFTKAIIKNDGSAELERKSTAKGQMAVYFRYFADDEKYHKKYIEDIWNSEYPGSIVYSIEPQNIETTTPVFEYKISLNKFCTRLGKKIRFKPILNKSNLYEKYFNLNKRKYPLFLSFGYIVKEKIIYQFENKIKSIKLPDNVNIKSRWIELEINYNKKGDRVTVDYTLKFKKYKILPEEYIRLRKIILRIKKAEEQEIVGDGAKLY